METKNSIKANLPYNSYKKIGEKAGASLGWTKPVSYGHVIKCLNSYPDCPWKTSEVFNAVINASLQVIESERKSTQELQERVAATLAQTPIS